ncbi:phosphate acetyltransferase [Fulvivirga sp. M361]|uniref:phosphate acetyltransferase n=1 Tax=Fulvivirga sp. M361 TaxID=2594266 RepID=UPI00117B32B1|nr:phosphate acetyltransferase [Fulvivirga sp. M361]TRX60604.1 phosphate acetyltransferase [Fulvivirga sp. M361]
MASSIYVTSAEAHCGKSLICLGMADYVLRKTRRVSVFRPIITSNSKTKRDKNIDLLLTQFNLDQDYQETYAFRSREAQDLISGGQSHKLLDKIIRMYKALEAKSDFIICEGTDFISESSNFEFGLNVEIAKNLGVPVLVVGRGDQDRSIEEIINPIQLATENFVKNDCELLGVVVNRANEDDTAGLFHALETELVVKDLFLSVVPDNKLLKSATVGEVVEYLNAEVLYGHDHLQNQVFRYSIAAMKLENYLEKLTDNCMVITPGDRGEVVLGTLQAHNSKSYPNTSAIVLTAGLKPSPSIMKLLDGLPHNVPILSVTSNTYETATRLSSIDSHITPDNSIKIAESLRVFETHVNMEKMEEKSNKVKVRGMTPRMFQYNLTQTAREHKKHIVLAEGEDERILRATALLLEQDVVDLTLLGNPEKMEHKIASLGLNIDLDKITLLDPRSSNLFETYVNVFYELRKHKGINMDVARDTMSDVSYFGTMMVYQGDVDGMVSGAVHTTQHTIRPALQFIKTKPGYATVSSVFFMCLDDRVLVYGDCAINPNPNAQQLAEIAGSSAQTARAFGIDPKVAMLSYSSGESGKGADVEKVREATQLVKSNGYDFKVEGPIQYDAAVDLEVGLKKIPGSEVAGQATVLIFPDLNTGNNTYKAIQRETGAIAIGPVLQGLNKPVNDLSRGCTVTDIVNTVIITAIQSQNN